MDGAEDADFVDAWKGLSIGIAVVQLGWMLWILVSLRKTNNALRKAPTGQDAKAILSRVSEIPTFNPSLNATWRKKLGKSSQRFVPQLYNSEDDRESRNWMESVEGGSIEQPDVLGEKYITQKANSDALIEASAIPNPEAKTYVVLSIHQKFLRLQASNCFLWGFICLLLAALQSDFWSWGHPADKDSPEYTFYLGVAMLTGSGAALVDGLQVFLVQKNVGRKSIANVFRVAIGWGILNALVCVFLAYAPHHPENPEKQKDIWFEPFFIRAAMSLVFNLFILVKECGGSRESIRWGSLCWCCVKRRGFSPENLPLSSYEYNADSMAYDGSDKPSRTLYRPRQSWSPSPKLLAIVGGFSCHQFLTRRIRLSGLNVLMCMLLVAAFLLRDNSPDLGDDLGATIILIIFLVSNVLYTPFLYWTLVDDTRYWQESWKESLAATGSPTGDNIVIDFSALNYQQVLGRGGFSTVYRGTVWDSLQLKVAIKVLHVEEMTKEVVERFLDEVRLFVRFRHSNVVHFVGACISPPKFAIVMELCKPESLADLLKKHSDRVHDEYDRRMRKRLEKGKRREQSRSFISSATSTAEPDSEQRKALENSTSPHFEFGTDWDSESEEGERVITRRRSFGDRDAEEARRGLSSPPSTPTGGPARSRLATRGSFTDPRRARAKDTASTLPRPSRHGSAADDKSAKPPPSMIKKEKHAVEAWPKLFSAKRVMRIARCLADAMRYMHSLDILHRDLKSPNILFDAKDNPKICDFGLSRENALVNESNSFGGTISYMAPEVLRFQKVTKKSDVYSFGIIFWELLTSRSAWMKYYGAKKDRKKPVPRPRHLNHWKIMERVSKHRARPAILPQDNIHPVLLVLLRECWADDQDCRPSFVEIVRRLDAFEKSDHFKKFAIESGVFGEGASTKWLTNPANRKTSQLR